MPGGGAPRSLHRTAHAEFARAFERGEISNRDFHHRDHLRLAWAYLDESCSPDEAAGRVATAIRRFTTAARAADKYHETLTVFWTRSLARVRARLPDGVGLEEAVRADPRLLDKDLPLAYYSRERLFSDEGKRTWVEPDLRSLV